MIEDGRPFCPQCHAPQVRVEIASEAAASGVTPEADRRAGPDPLHRIALHASSGPSFFRVAWQAGLLGVIANIVPYGFGMILTGMLAPLLHHRAGGTRLPTATAARLGAMAGGIAFALTLVLKIVLLGERQQYRDLMMKALERSAANPDPAVQAALQWLHTPQGFAVALTFGMVGALILCMLVSAVGGLIGAKIFDDRPRPPF